MSEEEKKNADKKNEDSFDKLVLELARRYVASHMKIVDFIPQYNYINGSKFTAPKCVKTYRRIKEIPYRKPIYSEKTLYKKIKRFKSKSKEMQMEFLNKNYSNLGGLRENVRKVNDETIMCLITLVLDFPTLLTSTYRTYLNSKYGPNYKNNISIRTIERYLKYFRFNVKRAAFSPPNRNYIGARIFRVA